MTQPYLITMSGLDRTGKTTLCKELASKRNHTDIVYDRGVADNIAYNRLFKRDVEYWQYKVLIPDTALSIFVWLQCDPQVLRQRLIDTNHEDFDIEAHMAAFEDAWQLMHMMYNKARFFEYDTTTATTSDIADDLLRKVGLT